MKTRLLTDWHFTAYAGLTLPTGEANYRSRDGSIAPGMFLGFGKSSLTYSLTATKQVSEVTTLSFKAG